MPLGTPRPARDVRSPRTRAQARVTLACAMLGACVLSASGCDKLAERFKKKKAWKTFETSDGRGSLRVPAAWEKGGGLNPLASLEAFLPPGTRLNVISESKADFESFELAKYSKTVRAAMLENMKTMLGQGFALKRERPAQRLRVGPHQALRVVLEGELMGMGIRMLHVCVEGPRFVHQLIFHVPQELWEKQRGMLEDIVATFQERDVPAPRPRPREAGVFKIAKAKDRCATLGVPKDWHPLSEASEALCIAETDPGEDLVAMVMREARVDLDAKTLRAYADTVVANMKADQSNKGFTHEAYREARLAGLPALRVVLRFSIDGGKTVHEMVLVETPRHFYRIQVVAPPSRWAGAQALFERILQSFRPGPDGPVKAAPRGAPRPTPR